MAIELKDLVPYGHEDGDKIFFVRACDRRSDLVDPILCLCFKLYETTEYFIQIYQKCEKASWIDPISDDKTVHEEYRELVRKKLTPAALEHVIERFNAEIEILYDLEDPWKYKPVPSTDPETEVVHRYPVTTLCGSTRFKEEFMEVQKRLTLEGRIVISVGLFGHAGDDEVWSEGTKEMLDDMHKRKIDMAESIFVINKDGYIGSSTRSEIEYARRYGKKIEYLEPPTKTDTPS